ncbi:hypothetical protein HN51_043482 [Arachis hypogaea]|uniref:uncharacterized protein n=1 Tax=Arachis hypogaea TaxID=3818 RepID=UPI000DEE012D|nr:H/ACA ribonucleoprotein complex non-core subunit NAF1 [Arachis hypogaea]QHN95517.1 H/ACA ribonucleoprotein complex non-core subunit [Arachis hypogaea]
MALFSSPQPQQHQQQQSQSQSQPPQPQPETKAEEDYAIADSFINFDYVPEIEEMSAQNETDGGSEPIVSGSGSTRVVEEHGAGADESVNVGALGSSSRIREGIEQISLAGGSGGSDDDHADDEGSCENSESKSGASASSSPYSSSPAKSSDVKMEERDGERSEPEEGEIIESDRDDDDDDDDDGGLLRSIRSKNELEILPVVAPVNVTLGPHHQMLPVGVVVSFIGAKVTIKSMENHHPLNEGSILWITETRTPLGSIDEIFGHVERPYYVVRYNSENQVPKGIYQGASISFVPEFTDFVLNSNADLFKKGYDASSGDNDEEFLDDEKEAEYLRKLRMTKRGSSDQNVGGRRKEGKRSPPEGVLPMPAFPVAPAAPLHDHGHHSTFAGNARGLLALPAPLHDHRQHSTFSGHAQGPFLPAAPLHDHAQPSTFSGNAQGSYAVTTVVPPFTPANANPPFGIWTNTATIPQPQPAAPWLTPNTQIPHQWPQPVVPFQQQLNPNQVLLLATMFPGVQPNILAQQAMYPQGNWGQNQMPFGLNMNSPFPQIQHPPIYAGQQGSSSNGFQSQTNHSLDSNSVPFNHHAPHQFHPGSSANCGRRPFHHHGGRRGWNPAR